MAELSTSNHWIIGAEDISRKFYPSKLYTLLEKNEKVADRIEEVSKTIIAKKNCRGCIRHCQKQFPKCPNFIFKRKSLYLLHNKCIKFT